mgnify:CR=1 FL=1|tara:strand:+ start:3695 stop:4048 length:354 start_codon:yes stop_codon:yes gene_type:complete
MKKISKKQAAINRKKAELYIKIGMIREHKCTGCDRYDVPLSHSHKIPISRRKDLELDINNITYHCLDFGNRPGCHTLWSGGLADKQKLLDYWNSIHYIKEKDSEYYHLLMMDKNKLT